MIKYHCGFCGTGLDENKEEVTELPGNYNPHDYPADACRRCMQNETESHNYVTHEMAMDAQDLSLEGSIW